MGVDVVDWKLKANTAISFLDIFMVLNRSKCKTSAHDKTILAHEAEHKAFAASFEKCLPVNAIKAAMRAGYTETWQLAERFDSDEQYDEQYIEEVLRYWTDYRVWNSKQYSFY